MTIRDKLRQMFPDAQVAEKPSLQSNEVSLWIEGKYLIINQAHITEKEMNLIKIMAGPQPVDSVWHDALLEQKKVALPLASFRIVYFHTHALLIDPDQWLQLLTTFFDNSIDAFFISAQYGLIVIGDHHVELDHVRAMIQTLDDDFSTQTSLYIGKMMQDHSFRSFHNEEMDLFLQFKKPQTVLTFEDIYANAYIKPLGMQSAVLSHLAQQIKANPEYAEVIRLLFKAQGNITQAAQLGFIHRNTLIYRMDRFWDQFDLNLRNLNILIMCYLLLE